MRAGSSAYLLLGLSALIGTIAAALAFSVLRFFAAARDTRQQRGSGEAALLASALEEALVKLRAQERATAARAEASERLSGEIIASLTAGLLVVGLDAEIRILNPAGRRLLHVADDTSLGDYRTLVDEPALVSLIHDCLANRAAIVRRTVELSAPNRATTHLGVTVSPLMGNNGELNGAICLFTDLTVIKQLEEQLRLKESLAVVGELTAGIAHEFRNGLATIHGYGKLLDPKALPEQYRPYVQGIREETVTLSQIVTNFLNFAKPTALSLTRVDLRAVCERASEEFRAEARARGGDVTLRGMFAAIDGDEVLLRQAFSNLLRNAVEACTEANVAPVIVVESTVDGTQARIAVEDSGPGIPPDRREHVFRPFFTAKRHGTGLGLALVQKIVVSHNGRIIASASPLGGASLQIVLPIAS